MEYLFSYGTLRNGEVQQKLFGRLLNSSEDVLTGFKTVEAEIDDEAFLARGEAKQQLTAVASAADSIDGLVLEITPAELAMLDRYEPYDYERIAVRLESGKKAWMYLKKI